MLGSVLFHGWVESAIYTSIVDEENHEVTLDREFRSFSKPNKLNVRFQFGEPGDYYYEPQIEDYSFTESGEDPVCALLKGSTGMSDREIAKTLGVPLSQLRIRLKELSKKNKIMLVKEGNSVKAVLKGGEINE